MRNSRSFSAWALRAPGTAHVTCEAGHPRPNRLLSRLRPPAPEEAIPGRKLCHTLALAFTEPPLARRTSLPAAAGLTRESASRCAVLRGAAAGISSCRRRTCPERSGSTAPATLPAGGDRSDPERKLKSTFPTGCPPPPPASAWASPPGPTPAPFSLTFPETKPAQVHLPNGFEVVNVPALRPPHLGRHSPEQPARLSLQQPGRPRPRAAPPLRPLQAVGGPRLRPSHGPAEAVSPVSSGPPRPAQPLSAPSGALARPAPGSARALCPRPQVPGGGQLPRRPPENVWACTNAYAPAGPSAVPDTGDAVVRRTVPCVQGLALAKRGIQHNPRVRRGPSLPFRALSTSTTASSGKSPRATPPLPLRRPANETSRPRLGTSQRAAHSRVCGPAPSAPGHWPMRARNHLQGAGLLTERGGVP